MVVALMVIILTPVRAEDTIKVGVLHSLSGTMAISETTLKDTVLMLVEEQNKKGGLLGKQLEAVVVDPATGERQSSLFTVDYPISEVDVHANGDEIAFISSHDAFGSGTTGPDELKVWTPDHGILDIREEQSSVGW